MRKARHKYEATLVESIKQKPKQLYKYIKVQQKVEPAIMLCMLLKTEQS